MEREMKVVAWMDDGSTHTRHDGSKHRVVTVDTLAGMPRAAAEPYTEPLVTQASATAAIELLEKRIGVLEAENAKLLMAAASVCQYIDGKLPIRGWLRDNDHSRAALGELSALAQTEGR
jgi:hypothetical protein